MNNSNELAEDIISGISNKEPLADLLLKVKMYATLKKDNRMLEWVQGELEGYENKPPEYRILDCAVKVKVFRPFVGYESAYFPTEMIQDRRIRERIVKMPIHASITEVEELSKQPGHILLDLPLAVGKYFEPYLSFDFQGATQETTPSALHNITIRVKDILLTYFLKIADGENIDFTAMTKLRFGDMNITNSNIVMSCGDMSITNSVVNSEQSHFNPTSLNELKHILTEIEKKLTPNDKEYWKAVNKVREELNSSKPSKAKINLLWRGMGNILNGAASGICSELISKGLRLIGLL